MNKLVLKPRLSEKSYGQSQTLRTYVFLVPMDANKQTVAQAIEEQFKVTVTNVNILRVGGKNKRTFMNRRGKFVSGSRSDIKKAYITLKEGDSLPVFAAEEEAEKQQEKAQQAADKAMEKQAKKDKKEKK